MADEDEDLELQRAILASMGGGAAFGGGGGTMGGGVSDLSGFAGITSDGDGFGLDVFQDPSQPEQPTDDNPFAVFGEAMFPGAFEEPIHPRATPSRRRGSRKKRSSRLRLSVEYGGDDADPELAAALAASLSGFYVPSEETTDASGLGGLRTAAEIAPVASDEPREVVDTERLMAMELDSDDEIDMTMILQKQRENMLADTQRRLTKLVKESGQMTEERKDCPVCFDSTQLVILERCKHEICQVCLLGFLEVAVKDLTQYPLTCFQAGCAEHLAFSDLANAFQNTPDLMLIYDRFSAFSALPEFERTQCPVCDLPFALKDTSTVIRREDFEWIEPSTRSKCTACDNEFPTLRFSQEHKKHHCRLCGEIFCHDCTRYLLPLHAAHINYQKRRIAAIKKQADQSVSSWSLVASWFSKGASVTSAVALAGGTPATAVDLGSPSPPSSKKKSRIQKRSSSKSKRTVSDAMELKDDSDSENDDSDDGDDVEYSDKKEAEETEEEDRPLTAEEAFEEDWRIYHEVLVNEKARSCEKCFLAFHRTVCPECAHVWCGHCREPFHRVELGEICVDFADAAASASKRRRAADEEQLALSREFISKQSWSRCPGCKVIIAKTEGCNHMTHKKCQNPNEGADCHFCYCCGEKLYGSGHKNEADGTCHFPNGVFEDCRKYTTLDKMKRKAMLQAELDGTSDTSGKRRNSKNCLIM